MNLGHQYLNTFVIAGMVVGLIGGVMVALGWPSTEETLAGIEQSGSMLVVFLGGVAAWAGNSLLLVGLVGYGVKYGRQASPEKTVS